MSTAAYFKAPTEIRTLPVASEGHTYLLDYPHSTVMEGALLEVLQEKAYPPVPYLQDVPGAILDIGANVGAASLLFSCRYPGRDIYAFEPSPSIYPFLEQNAARLPSVRTFNVGLFDRDDRSHLHTGPHASVTSSMGRSELNGTGHEEIVLRRASAVIGELPIDRIALLKIDTEGAEVPILRDLAPMLDRVSAVFLEYHSENDRLEIDRILAPRFLLCLAEVKFPHRGNLIYVAREVIAEKTDLGRYEITGVGV